MKCTFRTTAFVLAATTLLSLTAAGHSAATGSEPVEPPATPSADADPAAAGDPVAPDPAADPAAAGDQVEVDPAAAAATAKLLGIPVAEATVRLEQQEALGDQGAQIEGSLAGRSGGSYLDANGKLVVTVLDAAGNSAVVRSGARAQRVDDSAARLDNIMRKLDQKAARGGPGSVQGWHVDVPTNTVVVTVTAGANDAKHAGDDQPGDELRRERQDRVRRRRTGATDRRVVGGWERDRHCERWNLLGRLQHGRRCWSARRAHRWPLRQPTGDDEPQRLLDRRHSDGELPR